MMMMTMMMIMTGKNGDKITEMPLKARINTSFWSFASSSRSITREITVMTSSIISKTTEKPTKRNISAVSPLPIIKFLCFLVCVFLLVCVSLCFLLSVFLPSFTSFFLSLPLYFFISYLISFFFRLFTSFFLFLLLSTFLSFFLSFCLSVSLSFFLCSSLYSFFFCFYLLISLLSLLAAWFAIEMSLTLRLGDGGMVLHRQEAQKDDGSIPAILVRLALGFIPITRGDDNCSFPLGLGRERF